jgi:hypothetical protein
MISENHFQSNSLHSFSRNWEYDILTALWSEGIIFISNKFIFNKKFFVIFQ